MEKENNADTMRKRTIETVWRQYDAGREYKTRAGIYETARTNERFYSGEQWYGVNDTTLPKPVFNIVRRITDYLICSIVRGNVSLRYRTDTVPSGLNAAQKQLLSEGAEAMTENAKYRWECSGMDRLVYKVLLNAALCGDGAFYCHFDPDIYTGQPYRGDIATTVVDSMDIYPADPTSDDIQSQEYIILAGRSSVGRLKREAASAGASEAQLALIIPDGENAVDVGDGEAKATFLIKFYRVDGCVVFEKITRGCFIRKAQTKCRLYPVAYFNWYTKKNSFHGTSPVSGLIPNQKYINKAYAMLMKHMTDTAFSKVIYDKSKIPEWTNEVGEAIGAFGGGNISDAVCVVGTGELQNGYTELIDNAIEVTRELSGATDSALGNTDPTNTSAILALQETSRIPLEMVRGAYYKCLEDLADIWADMMCAFYPSERLLPYRSHGVTEGREVDYALLRRMLPHAYVDVGDIINFSTSSTQALLDKLLDGGHISLSDYLRRLPKGLLAESGELIEKAETAEKTKKEGRTDE